MCAPWVTRHTSIQYSSSCHTCANMGTLRFFSAAMICALKAAKSHSNGTLRNLHEMHVAQ